MASASVLCSTPAATAIFPDNAKVRLIDDDLSQGLVSGDEGIIVDRVDEEGTAYLVEFSEIQDPTVVDEETGASGGGGGGGGNDRSVVVRRDLNIDPKNFQPLVTVVQAGKLALVQ
ncbi:hypothetical protein HDU76_003685 [Blyttiomyces sp. JEL0837]|nr:hypothetical protein HDU76_003685 [Blyttiomyces sp. JEL0837]